MRFLILKDKKITNVGFKSLTQEFSNFIFSQTEIVPKFFIKEIDYINVPTEADSDGDLKPTKVYIQKLMKEVHTEYGDYGVDSVVMLVHDSNWRFDGIWGTNWSNIYYKYHVHLCRFDSKNIVNSFGTLYHEWMHSLDSLIKTHVGFEIDDLFKDYSCFVDWDNSWVHGNRNHTCKNKEFSYIRGKDNTQALKRIKPYLQQAYQIRKDLYFKPLTNLQKYFISYLRALLNQKTIHKI